METNIEERSKDIEAKVQEEFSHPYQRVANGYKICCGWWYRFTRFI